MAVSGVFYIRDAWIGKTDPVLASWILFVIMMSLTCVTYMSNPQATWTGNIAVTAGLANTTMILIGVVAANIRYKTLRVAFDKTQKWCLVLGVGIVVFWFLTDQPLFSYSLVQIIAVVGYFAMIKKLRKARHTTEPLYIWVVTSVANLCALYPAWVQNDIFSWIYIARAIPSALLTIYFIRRIKKRAQLRLAA